MVCAWPFGRAALVPTKYDDCISGGTTQILFARVTLAFKGLSGSVRDVATVTDEFRGTNILQL